MTFFVEGAIHPLTQRIVGNNCPAVGRRRLFFLKYKKNYEHPIKGSEGTIFHHIPLCNIKLELYIRMMAEQKNNADHPVYKNTIKK